VNGVDEVLHRLYGKRRVLRDPRDLAGNARRGRGRCGGVSKDGASFRHSIGRQRGETAAGWTKSGELGAEGEEG